MIILNKRFTTILWTFWVLSIISQWTISTCGAEVITTSEKSATEKLKILGVFDYAGKSHFNVFKPLLEELGRRGHELTVISYFPRSNESSPLPNYRDISILGPEGVLLDVVDVSVKRKSSLNPYITMQKLIELTSQCRKVLEKDIVQKFIKSQEKFDVVLTEAFASDCSIAFAHHFNAPFIAISSHILMPWASSRLLNPDNPTYVPTVFSSFTPKMNFFERIANSFLVASLNFAYDFLITPKIQLIVEDAFGKKFPPLAEIASNTSAILVNSHYSLHGAKPDLPNIVEVGGLHINNPEPLPKDLKKILDDAEEGVLFFSWGSMIKASSMSNNTLKDILQVLGSIPRKVIWKWESENLIGKPPNVIIRKWLPQAAILHHPNVKCYLAHGGLLGMGEGINAGVPMVIVPTFGDQFVNAAAAKYRGVAVVLEWEELNAESLKNAIDQVFNDSSYQKNAKKLQKAWRDRPATPLDTAVWWTEYIGRGNGNEYLKSSASSLLWCQRYLLDIMLVLFIALFIIIALAYYLLSLLFKFFKSFSKTNSTRRSSKKEMELTCSEIRSSDIITASHRYRH